jgi:hypothetical protein
MIIDEIMLFTRIVRWLKHLWRTMGELNEFVGTIKHSRLALQSPKKCSWWWGCTST